MQTVARRDMAARILVARGHGDLKENAEYHAAKEDQAHLETRILRLRERLRNAVVVDTVQGGNRMAFAREAEVRDLNTDEVHQWTIVGAASRSRRRQALRGVSRRQGPAGPARRTTVQLDTPRGTRRLRVERLT